MTPWLRFTLRAAGLPLVLGVVSVPCGAVPSYGVTRWSGTTRPHEAEAPPSGTTSASPGRSTPASGSTAAAGPAAAAASASASVSASASSSASPSASPGPSRAGSRAGEGRVRPGRPETDSDSREDQGGGGRDGQRDPDGHDHHGHRADGRDEDAESTLPTPGTAAESPEQAAVVPSAPPLRPAGGTDHSAPVSEPVLQILPLGSGLVLIGLGLGLAFVALRVRRG
ncbi:hypothetical protein [Streptomyces sp. NPDC086787]|uniref:hypothetical protein n=1 Tax=Streptomyces sp. NPDC086787 TaxID=3365759 RepID=UPI00380929FE